MDKRIWSALLFLVLVQAAAGQNAGNGGAGARGNNLYFTVSDYLSQTVPGAKVIVCHNAAMTLGCMQGITDMNGNVSFYIEPFTLTQAQSLTPSMTSDPIGWGIMSAFDIFLSLVNLRHDLGHAVASGSVPQPLPADQLLAYNVTTESGQGKAGTVLMSSDGGVEYGDERVSVVLDSGFGFVPQWTDFFPGCALNADNNPVRCMFEIVLPNFHLQANANLIMLSVKSVFALDIIGMIVSFPTNPLESINKIVGWLFAIVTPLFMVFVITLITLIEIYLLASVTFLAWRYAFDALFQMEILNRQTYLPFVLIFFVAAVAVSLWLLGVDLNIWKLFITF